MSRRIIHIVARSNPASEAFERLGRELHVDSLVVPDCYAALGHLALEGPRTFEAVLTCLDGLGAADAEFFQLVGRRFRDVALYVYGSDAAGLGAGEALAAGARSMITEEAFGQRFAPPTHRAQDAPPAGLPQAVEDGDPAEANPFERGVARAAGPERRQPDEAECDSPAASGGVPEAEAGALLTDAEIEALLGDDEDSESGQAGVGRPADETDS